MATVNLGRIKPVWHGAWNSSTQYVVDDIVQYNNHAWIATATNTNSAPADANANWNLLARGSDIPAQTGHAGKALVTDGTNLSWDKAGLVLGGASTTTSGGTAVSNTVSWNSNWNTHGSAHLTINYAPVSATSTLFIYTSAVGALSGNARGYTGIKHDGTIVAWAGLNGYAADTGNAAMSAAVASGSTNSRAIHFMNFGADGGNVLTLGRAQGDGSTNRLYPEMSSMHVIEVELP